MTSFVSFEGFRKESFPTIPGETLINHYWSDCTGNGPFYIQDKNRLYDVRIYHAGYWAVGDLIKADIQKELDSLKKITVVRHTIRHLNLSYWVLEIPDEPNLFVCEYGMYSHLKDYLVNPWSVYDISSITHLVDKIYRDGGTHSGIRRPHDGCTIALCA